MFTMKIYLIILLTFWNTNGLNSSRSLDLRWQNINCSIVSQSHVRFFNCIINERPRNRGNHVTVHLQFKRNIKKLLMHFKILLSLQGKKELEFLNFRCDGCQIVGRKSNNPLIASATEILLQSGNFTRKCPLLANTTYSLEKIPLIPEYFPGFTPDMKIISIIKLFTNKILMLKSIAVAGAIYK